MSHRPNPPLYFNWTDDVGNIYQAPVLVGRLGNPVGVVYDAEGTTYRLQVEAQLTGSGGGAVASETTGTREAMAVSYPELLAAVLRIEAALDKINAQLADITGEDDPL